MKTSRFALATLCLVLPFLAPAPLCAQGKDSPGAQAPCPPNAALVFWRAWNGRVPTVWDPKYLEADFTKFDASWQPSAQVTTNLEAAQPDILEVIKAARMDYCDWGAPIREDGYETTLPHLSRLRATARVLMADARRLLAKNDMPAAADRLAALVLLSRQLRNDHTVVSVRTGQTLGVDLGMSEIRRLADAGRLDDMSRGILIEALNKVSGSDPCGMREALLEEPKLIRITIQRRCKGPQAVAIFIQQFAQRSKEEDRAASGILQLDEAGLLAQADRSATMYADVIANWDLPSAIANIRGIEQQRDEGGFGPVAKLAGTDDLNHLRRLVALYENFVKDTLAKLTSPAPAAPAPETPGATPAK